MKTIWKFPLGVTSIQQVDMPYGAEILTVQTQGEGACLWAKVDPHGFNQKRTIAIHGTGHKFEEYQNRYIGTFQIASFVWHVFEVLS